MLYPDAQPQDKSSGSGTSAKPKPKPIPALPAVIYTAFGIQEAEKLRERIKKAEEYRERVRAAARNSDKPKQDAAAQKRRPSIPAVIYTAFDKDEADELRERIEKVKDRGKPSPSDFPQDISQGEQLDAQSLPDLQSFYAEPDWPVSRPLTEGQKYHVDHLLSIEDDTLARSMLIGIRRDGMPSPKYLNDYLARFAEWGWDEISDERTLELLDTIRQSNWDAWLERADSAPVENAAQDLANDMIESVQVIDAATGQVLLSRVGVLGAGGGQSVGLQAEEVQTFQGRELIFVHNHPNGAAASDADLRTAFLAGAELLLVVTPRGYEYAYIRGENGMALVREGDASYEVSPATAEEYVELTGRSWRQATADRLNPPEYLMLQDEDEPTLEIEVSGPLRIYDQETRVRGEDKQSLWVYDFSEAPERFKILGKSRLNHSVVLIDMHGEARFWIDLDQTDVLNISEIDLARVPTVDQRGRPVQISEQIVTPTGYVLQSFVVDESVVVREPHDKSLGIELSDTVWADRSGVGLLSRDFNPIGWTDPHPFQLQSPVIGPDVRVELVSREDADDRGLGNYVVISFPASVYQADEGIMQRLADEPKHDPSEWREDGRIFIGFGHLSEIAEHIQPGVYIDDENKASIGTTGNTGWQQNYDIHLDLSLAYFGSPSSGGTGMVDTTKLLRWKTDFVDYYTAFAERSNLFPDNNIFTVYGENLDPVRVWPELDELRRAEYAKGESIYARK